MLCAKPGRTTMERQFEAATFDLNKTHVTTHVDLTDAEGVVIYDSDNHLYTGRSLIAFNDVRQTLAGGYGALLALCEGRFQHQRCMWRCYHGKDIIGALTVRKPKLESVALHSAAAVQDRALHRAHWQWHRLVRRRGLVPQYLQPLRRLTAYVQAVKRGGAPAHADVRASAEVNTLANALEGMREELEGRDYAATYVQASDARAEEPARRYPGNVRTACGRQAWTNTQRQRFADNLRHECGRAEHLLRQLVRLAEVERLKTLPSKTEVDLAQLARQVCAELSGAAAARQVLCELDAPGEPCRVEGDMVLLKRAADQPAGETPSSFFSARR